MINELTIIYVALSSLLLGAWAGGIPHSQRFILTLRFSFGYLFYILKVLLILSVPYLIIHGAFAFICFDMSIFTDPINTLENAHVFTRVVYLAVMVVGMCLAGCAAFDDSLIERPQPLKVTLKKLEGGKSDET